MSPLPDDRWFEVESVGDVTIIRFNHRHIWDEDQIEGIGTHLNTLLTEKESRKLLVNFGRVESVSSRMAAKLIALNKRLKSANGQLALCELQPRVLEALEILRLPRLLFIYKNERAALEGLAEGQRPPEKGSGN